MAAFPLGLSATFRHQTGVVLTIWYNALYQMARARQAAILGKSSPQLSLKLGSALECGPQDRIKQEVEQLAPREETREKLRRRIVAAARDLLSETASIEFSMRALAVKAEVAHVTPYNIFGSKQAVLLAVLDADMAEFEQALQARQKSDPLTEIFEVVRLCIEFWFSEPVFYKTLYRELLDIKGAHQTLAMPLREGFWRRLTRSMVVQKHVQSFVAEEPLAMNLRRITLQTIGVWIARDLSQVEVEAELGYSISLALLGVATAGSTARVQEQFLSYQRTLVRASNRAV